MRHGLRNGIATPAVAGAPVALRPVTAADLPVLAAWDREPEIVSLMGKTFADEDGMCNWYRRALQDRRFRALAVETRDGRLIGEVELDHIDWHKHAAELRICIGAREVWGQGYGRAALLAFLDLAFSQWGLRQVYLRVYRDNHRAVALYLSSGFVTKGMLMPSRRWRDRGPVLLMSITRERYQRLHRATGSETRA